MPSNEDNLSLNVFGYWDEPEQAWIALALEMDLRGYGPTFEEAVKELSEVVAMQISFATLKKQPQLIWRPAEPVYWRLFEEARRNRLEEFVLRSTPRNPQYTVRDLSIPPPHIIANLPDFELADA